MLHDRAPLGIQLGIFGGAFGITTPLRALPGGQNPIETLMKMGGLRGSIPCFFKGFGGIPLKYFQGIPPSKRVVILFLGGDGNFLGEV